MEVFERFLFSFASILPASYGYVKRKIFILVEADHYRERVAVTSIWTLCLRCTLAVIHKVYRYGAVVQITKA